MGKNIIHLLVLAVFIGFVNFPALGRFFITDLSSGEMGTAYVNVRNPGSGDIEDLNVKITFYDLGLQYASQTFDVEGRDSVLVRVFMPIPKDVQPGVYLAKISTGNDDFKDSQHVWVGVY
ncbi:hypothetical protein HYV84_04375 [Candidatus Woesearchaeota archaeon]|nr:hypothetical protein [Candidatus Woesearchaeota archaeon]